MASLDESQLDLMVNAFIAKYDSQPDHKKISFVNTLISRAVGQPDAIFDELNEALLQLDAISVFVSKITARDNLSIDKSELERLHNTRTRFTRTRVLVKQQKIQDWLGDEEYTACFDKMAGLSAVEELQQFLTRGRDILCAKGTRRLIYAWLNYAIGSRLGSKRRGIRKSPMVIRGDIRKAKQSLDGYLEKVSCLAPPLRLDQEQHEFAIFKAKCKAFRDAFSQHGLSLNRFGLYSSSGDEGDYEGSESEEESTCQVPITPPTSVDNEREDVADSSASNLTSAVPCPGQTASTSNMDISHTTGTSEEMDIDNEPDTNPPASRLRPLPHRSSNRDSSDDGDKCTCDKAVVRKELWGYTATLKNPHEGLGGEGLWMDEEKRIYLTPECEAAIEAYIETSSAEDGHGRASTLVCNSTRRRLMKMVNIANNVSRAEGDKRIRLLWESRDDIRAWRSQHDSDGWLTQHSKWKDNPDHLHHFRTAAKMLPPISYDKERLKQQMFGESKSTIDSEMEQLGNSVYDDGFAWVREDNSNLIALMREEMDALHHHTYRNARNGRHFKGWSNASHYLLCMQMIRQDLSLYGLTLATRLDNGPYSYQLSCIPAQAKHTAEGDDPYFRHIDFNPGRLDDEDLIRRDKTGQYRLQVAVSLDDEDDKFNCTYVLDGLRRNNFEDLNKVRKVTKISSGNVVSLGHARITDSEIKKAIGRRYRPIPAPAGGVRFMDPVTYHGSSKEPVTNQTRDQVKTRRVLFPWYTRVDPELLPTGEVVHSFETADLGLDGEESKVLNPVEDYICGNMTMKRPPTTGGGQKPIKSRLPFRFPAQSLLLPTNHLSAAIANMTSWDQPAVQAQARDFFWNPYVLIQRQRREFVQRFREHMVIFRKAEQEMFGEDSFYAKNPDRLAPMLVKDVWTDNLDKLYIRHSCIREYLAGTGPPQECQGERCIIAASLVN